MTLETRTPTGIPPWPLILLEGAEKAGKSWAAAEFTSCERIGKKLWLDLGEGAGDEYFALPGADYEIILHDGTWGRIIAQVREAHQAAREALTAGEKPYLLIVDTGTELWEMLKDWTAQRARTSKWAKELLKKDPNAEIKPSTNLWNDANDRHSQWMRLLMTFPGIVVVTARGKEVASIDAKGNPIPNAKDYRVEGHKNIAFDCNAWVRFSRTESPVVVGVRSVHSGLRPGVDKPVAVPDFTLEWLVFDLLKCDPAKTLARDLVTKPELEDVAVRAGAASTRDEISAVWALAKNADYLDMAVSEGVTIRSTLQARIEQMKADEAKTLEAKTVETAGVE